MNAEFLANVLDTAADLLKKRTAEIRATSRNMTPSVTKTEIDGLCLTLGSYAALSICLAEAIRREIKSPRQ